MTLWVLILVYLLVGCVRTAYLLADMALETQEYLDVSATEMGFSVLFWGINVMTSVLANLIVEIETRGDDE